MDAGLVLTVLALVACLARSAVKRRDPTLPCVLLSLWATSLALAAADAQMATFVFTAALLNLAVSGIALALVIRDPGRMDARAVGGLSLAIMPAHFVMSASNGTANWTIYAWACNVIYIAQCLVAGGWLDGLGRRVAGLVSRLRPVSLFRGRSG